MAASTQSGASKYADRNIVTGSLGNDFLRITKNGQPVAGMPYGVPGAMQFAPQQSACYLSITVVQAKLAKNYGLSRMDPYCRLRVGTAIFETAAAYNGAKNPRWNKRMQCPIQKDVNSIYIEIYDECTFSIDERIAWGLVTVSEEVFAGEFLDKWYPLSGKQGDDKEGMINLFIEYREGTFPTQPYMGVGPPYVMYGAPMAPMVYPYPAMITTQTVVPPVGVPAVQPPPQVAPIYSDEDVKNIKDMFPSLDDDVILSVLDSNGGNVDRTINTLLTMTSES